jgi:hypothetical protein
MAVAPAMSDPAGQTRKAYNACLKKVAEAKTSDKLSAEAFTSAVKASCAAEEAAFIKSIVDFDLKTGLKRAEAEEGAREQVQDSLANAVDTYSASANPN